MFNRTFAKIAPVESKTVLTIIAVALAGLVAGFILANTMNRSEMSMLRAEVEQLKQSRTASSDPSNMSLTPEEIRATIQKADAAPNDFQTQMGIGIALYRYATTKEDPGLLRQAIKILERASALNPEDYDVNLMLGHAEFDVGYFDKNNDALARSRKYYVKTLAMRPDNSDVIVDLGLTYFLQTPPDYENAVTEFRRSLSKDPKHEKTLQYIVQALIKQNKTAEAAEFLQRLREVNPQNKSIAESSALLANTKPAG